MVNLGMRLRRLGRLRLVVAASFVLAVLAGLSSGYRVNLIPPGIAARSAGVAGAHTQILVDDRKVSVLNAGFDQDSYGYLANGAILAGTELMSGPIQARIASLMGIPVSSLTVADPQDPILLQTPPQTPQPYSLVVAPRPSVPIVNVYAQAPTQTAALKLADASAQALNGDLVEAGGFELRATQLGESAPASPGGGFSIKSALERFVLVLALGVALTSVLQRSRRTRRPKRRVWKIAS